jgi:hypothetical protein
MQELLDLGLKTQGFFIGTHYVTPHELFLVKAEMAQALTPKWGGGRRFQEAQMK